MLFVSPEHVDVVTDNFMQMAKGTLDDFDRPTLRAQVAQGLNKSSEDFRLQNPEASRALDLVQLNAVQQAAVLKSVHAEGDPRVLKMGQEIAGVIHSGLTVSDNKDGVKESLARYVSSRAPLIRKLREEACPPEMPEICEDDDEGMQLTMDDSGMRLAQSLDNDWDLEVDMSRPTSSDSTVMLPARRLKGGKGGSGFSLTQGLQLASAAQKYAKKFKKMAKKFGISMPEVKKALKKVNVQQLMTCVLENAAKADPTSMMKCGAQFASAAMSVMKSLVGGGGSSSSSSSSKGGKGGGSSRRRKTMFSGFP
jgi:predicted DNA binding protein